VFSLIPEDASIILRPRMVAEVRGVIEPDGSGNMVTPDSHTNETVLRVLSDMATLHGHNDFCRSTPERRDATTSRKLEYYAVRVVCVPAMTLRVIEMCLVLARPKLIVSESSGGGEQSEGFVSSSTRTTPVRLRSIIEEF
jgi:hypothetical protein